MNPARSAILRPWIFGAAVFVITFAVFARLTSYSFSWWDDQSTIHQNPRLNPPTLETLRYYWTTADESATMALYVPVTYTVWSALAKIAHRDRPDADGMQLDARVFHTANVLIHALTAVIVFVLLRRLFKKRTEVVRSRAVLDVTPTSGLSEFLSDANDLGSSKPEARTGGPGHDKASGRVNTVAFFGALLFAVHPVQVETVAWISGTKDLLCGLFGISALLLYVRSIQRPTSLSVLTVSPSDIHVRQWAYRLRYVAGFGLFVLGMLSKPTAVVVPLMGVVIAVFVYGRSLKGTVVSLLPWFALMLPFLYWTRKYQPDNWADPLPIWVRAGDALDAITFYFFKLAWPIHLAIDYGHNPRAILQSHLIYFTWIIPVNVVAFLCWRRRTLGPLIAASLLFLMPLLPVLGFVPFEFQHISTTADHYLYLPMLGVAFAMCFTVDQWKIPNYVVVLLLAALALRSILQEPYWKESRALFEHALSVNPNSVDSCDNLGFYAGRIARRLDTAGQHAQAQPYFVESIHWYQKSLSMEPDNVPSLFNLALDYQVTGRMDLAKVQIDRIAAAQAHIPAGLRMDPLRVARLLVEFGDLPRAAAWLDQAMRNDPGNTDALKARLKVQQMMERPSTQR